VRYPAIKPFSLIGTPFNGLVGRKGHVNCASPSDRSLRMVMHLGVGDAFIEQPRVHLVDF
jgi:hypothetical protein